MQWYYQNGSEGSLPRFSAYRSVVVESAPERGEKDDDSDRTKQEPGD